MNGTCRDLDHDWQWTTSDAFRRCRREGCKAVQRLYRGKWVDIVRVVRRDVQDVSRKEPLQGILFQ